MRTSLLAAGLVVAGLALAAGPAAAVELTREEVTGRMDPVNDTALADIVVGRFKLTIRTLPNFDPEQPARFSPEEILVEARGLDTSRDEDGNRPPYHVFGVTNGNNNSLPGPSNQTIDFGPINLNSRGVGRLRLTNPRDFFSGTVTSLRDFEGGVIEIRVFNSTTLRGFVGGFSTVGEGGRGQGFGARSVGSSRLHATDAGGRARGRITAAFAPGNPDDYQTIHVDCDTLGNSGNVFSVVVIDGAGNTWFLGNIFTRTVFGDGTFRSNSVGSLDVVSGQVQGPRAFELPPFSFPEGGILSMGGWTVEVRDNQGVAFLTGFFPVLSVE